MKKAWYPIKFEPILKEKIWGGEKLNQLFSKKSSLQNIGESWEVSGVDGSISIVQNGYLKGNSLIDLIEEYKEDLVGDKVYNKFGNQFPLLIKFIDASADLSVQLHPNDDLAKARHNSFGKTEMWYIMQADPNSRLVLGFKNQTDLATYQKHLSNKSLATILNNVPIKTGDTFFIPTGTVHAIGAGIVLAEIQQTSDITYRVYDWDRVDKNGNSRDLHQEEALDAINFDFKGEKAIYNEQVNSSNTMVSCPFFRTNYLPVEGEMKMNYEALDSFVIYMCVEGTSTLESHDFKVSLNCGETVLIPAQLKHFTIKSEKAKILEIFI